MKKQEYLTYTIRCPMYVSIEDICDKPATHWIEVILIEYVDYKGERIPKTKVGVDVACEECFNGMSTLGRRWRKMKPGENTITVKL